MSTARPRVLFVLTSHSKLGASGKSAGWYLPEFAHPYEQLRSVADITVASPAGGAAPVDEASVAGFKDQDEVCKTFWETQSTLWTNTEKLSNFLGKSKDFAAIYYVGGHGPMWDLANDETSIKIIKEFYENDKIVSAICHGSAVLLNVKLSDGSYLIDGAAVTGLSSSEADAIKVSDFVPYVLEKELNARTGGNYEKADKPWGEKVVVSKGGKLITGQNPFSSSALGKALAAGLSA